MDDDLVTIQLIFTNDKTSIISWLVRLFTCSRWSHVGLVYKNDVLVIEATSSKGVALKEMNTLKSESSDWLIVEHTVTREQSRKIKEFCCQQVGSKYDYRAVLGVLLQGHDWQSDDKWCCSELVAKAFNDAGKPLFNPMFIDRITPEHLVCLPDTNIIDTNVGEFLCYVDKTATE